jgi:hypothetical protein
MRAGNRQRQQKNGAKQDRSQPQKRLRERLSSE